MSEVHDAFSTVIHVTANGVIHGGHGVETTDGTFNENDGARVAWGVLNQVEDCADGDTVPVTVLGPVKMWCDGSSAISVGSWIATNSSGHGVVDTTAGHRLVGRALEALASGTGFIEVLVYPSLG